MIQVAVDKLTNFFSTKNEIGEIDKVKMQYTIEVILADLSKFIIMFLLFSSLNMKLDFIMATIALFVLRTFTGGLHFKTYWGCLSFSIIFFYLTIYSAYNYALNDFTIIFIYLSLLIVVALFAPIIHRSRPRLKKKREIRFKLIGISYMFFHLLMYFITDKNPYFTIATWVFIYQVIQLLLGKVVSKYETVKAIL